MVDLVQKNQLSPPTITSFDEIQVYLHSLQNDTPFFRGWPGLVRHYNSVEFHEKLSNIGIARIPHFEGANSVSVFGGWNLMISKFSTKKREAIEFIKFTHRPENQKLLFEIGGYIPVNKAVYNDSTFQNEHRLLKNIIN